MSEAFRMNWLLYRGEKFNANFYYQSGVDIDHSFLLAGKEQRVLLTPEMNREAAEASFEGEVIVYGKNPLRNITETIKRTELLGLDLHSLPALLYLRIAKEFKKTKDISIELLTARSIKGKKEIKLMKRAARLSKKIIASAGEFPEPTEKETAAELILSTYSAGAKPAFTPIVACGENSSKPHSNPTKKKIKSPLLIDYGTRFNYYNSDMTRCTFLSKEQEKIYRALKRIAKRIIEEVPKLKTGGDLANFSKILYKKEGLLYPPHSIGHGIGLDVHEKPSLSPNSKDLLKGTVFALEPAVYFPGEFGLRYENVIHFDGKKARVL